MKTTLPFNFPYCHSLVLKPFHALLMFSWLCLASPNIQATDVGGPIASNTTWTQVNSPYVLISDVIVNTGVTLTIEPGVIVEVPNLSYDLIVNGTVSAIGTVTDTIKFLGIGAFGGGTVHITGSGSGSQFSYALFDRLGISGSSALDCAVRLDAETSFSHCSFTNNTDDVRALATAVGGFTSTNFLEDINLLSNSLATSATWPNADAGGFYYNFMGDQVLPVGETLSIMPGVDVRLPSLSYDLIINGTLLAIGDPANMIRIYGSGGFDGGSLAILSTSTGSELQFVRLDSMGTSGSSLYDCALFLEAETTIGNCIFANNTDDVRGRATALGGFEPTNSLEDINILSNSLDQTAVWPVADATGFYYNFFGDQVLPEDDTLTIMPGVDIRLPNLSYDLLINGTLLSVGTAVENIKFYGAGAFDGGSVAILPSSTGSEIAYTSFDSLGTSGSSLYDCALFLQAEAAINNCSFANNTDDVRGWATAFGGFANNNSLEDINVLGNSLDTSAVWPDADASGFYYNLFGDQILPAGDTLTIMPGVDVRFPNLSYDLVINGTLLALGTPSENIQFYGTGDFDGGSVAILSSSTGSAITHARFDSLGTSGSSLYDCALYLEAETTVANCIFANNTDDVKGRATAFGGFLNSNSLEDINVLTNSLDTTAVWPDADAGGFHYNLLGDLNVMTGDTLTIDPNVEVQFPNLSFDLLVMGTLIAEGTMSQSVRFTGVGANGGGSVTIFAGSQGSVFSYCHFENLGVSASSLYDTALYLDEEASVSNCVFALNLIDVRADADDVGGFQNNNSLDKINLLNNSLSTTCTWPNADSDGFAYYPEGDLTLPAGNTLTIEPSVEVQLSNLTFDMFIDGTISAVGNALQPITFLGVGGNGGGSIRIGGTSTGSVFDHCHFENLGTSASSLYDTAIQMEAEAWVGNSTFVNNGRDIKGRADAMGLLQDSNTLEDIEFTNASLGQTAVWPNADANGFFYRMVGDLEASLGDSLIIQPGVSVDFSTLSTDLLISGTLIAVGTEFQPVTFFSNGASGGGSIVIFDGSSNNKLRRVIIDGLGTSASSLYDSGIEIRGPDVSITRSNIKNSQNGIRINYPLPPAALLLDNPSIKRNIIENNTNGINVISGNPQIFRNSIINNSTFGLTNNLANVQVNACDNWWGDPSGPFNPATNPGGLGNPISDNALYLNCWLTSPPDAFLAVDLIDFTARLQGNEVLLEWITATETGHHYFEIERSSDGINFDYFSRIEASGDSESQISYYEIDPDPDFGTNYYRLKMVDLNGFFEYSDIRLVVFEKWWDSSFEITPVPFSTSFHIYLDAFPEGSTVIRLIDALGREHYSETIENVQGRISIDGLSKLAAGYYFLVIENTSGVFTRKVVKQ